MNTQAIEAGAIAVYNHDQPNHQAWPFDTADDWAKDGLRLRAQLVIEAARPHLETEIRRQIAEEILERRGREESDEKCCNACEARLDEAEFIATNLKNGKWYNDL